MVTLFLKYNLFNYLSVESCSTYEKAQGRTTAEKDKQVATPMATNLIFRFGKNENFFIGARYNTVSSNVVAATAKIAAALNAANNGTTAYAIGLDTIPAFSIGIDRMAISGGWYVTKKLFKNKR